MFNWHESNCRRPDVTFLDGLDIPSCLSCGAAGLVDEDEQTQTNGTVPESPSQTGFDLCWPASLSFVEDNSTQHDLDEALSQLNAEDANKRDRHLSSPRPSPAAAPEHTTSLYKSLYARKIRLLRLLPGAYRDPIRCILRTVDLASKPEYEALSYTWADVDGDTSKSARIYIGNSHDILAVTTNCANALRRLRYPRWPRELWVDAVCINQDDTSERSHQVGIMQYIYATALRVVIYLGEDPNDSERVPLAPWKFENHGNTLILNEEIRRLPYFSRIWVIQEVAVARNAWVLYGSSGSRWEDLVKYETLPNGNGGRLDEIHPWLKLVAQPRFRGLDELYGFLGATASSSASDPRDKIFALLGLFQETHVVGLVADYSLSHDQICAGLTAYFLQRHPELRYEVFLAMEPASRCKPPSWSVDWLSMGTHRPSESRLHRLDYAPGFLTRQKVACDRPDLTKIRCHGIGALIMTGALVFTLEDCILTQLPTFGSPLALRGLQYCPWASGEHKQRSFSNASWVRSTSEAFFWFYDAPCVQRTDEVFFFPALPVWFVVLRPMPGSDLYSFVGILSRTQTSQQSLADQEFTWRSFLDLLDEQTTLLFSAWNDFFNISFPCHWNRSFIWEAVKAFCVAVRQSWSLEAKRWMRRFMLKALDNPRKGNLQTRKYPEGTDLDPETELRSYPWEWLRWRADTIRNGAWNVPLRDRHVRPSPHNITDDPVIVQACWNLRRSWTPVNPEDAGDPPEVPWPDGFFSDPTVEIILQALGRTFGIDLTPMVDEMLKDEEFRTPRDLVMLLAGQRQRWRFQAVEALIEKYELSRGTRQHESEGEAEESARIVRWLKHSTGIEPGTSETPDFPTWAQSLPEFWPKPETSPDPPPPRFRARSDLRLYLAGVETRRARECLSRARAGQLGQADGGDENLTQQYRDAKSKWAPLLDLVRETEARMLPLEEAMSSCPTFQWFDRWENLFSETWREIRIV